MKIIQIISVLSIITGTQILAEKPFTPVDQEKAFSAIQLQVRNVQTDVLKMLEKIKTSFASKKLSITAKDITTTLKAVQQAVTAIQDLATKIEKSPQKNKEVIIKLHHLVKNVFTLNQPNIMTELQESVSLLMGPLYDQKNPEKSMLAYLERNFANTGINVQENIFHQVGLHADPTHEQLMQHYRQIVANPAESAQIIFMWRQLEYFMRQPIGMLMYTLWLQDKKAFNAVISKFPKSELVELYQYLNVPYRQKLYELTVSPAN